MTQTMYPTRYYVRTYIHDDGGYWQTQHITPDHDEARRLAAEYRVRLGSNLVTIQAA